MKSEVESALADLKRVSENGTAAEVKAATEKLQQASYKLAEALYKSTGAAAGAGAGGATNGATAQEGAASGAGAAGEDVIDAEFKEAK